MQARWYCTARIENKYTKVLTAISCTEIKLLIQSISSSYISSSEERLRSISYIVTQSRDAATPVCYNCTLNSDAIGYKHSTVQLQRHTHSHWTVHSAAPAYYQQSTQGEGPLHIGYHLWGWRGSEIFRDWSQNNSVWDDSAFWSCSSVRCWLIWLWIESSAAEDRMSLFSSDLVKHFSYQICVSFILFGLKKFLLYSVTVSVFNFFSVIVPFLVKLMKFFSV